MTTTERLSVATPADWVPGPEQGFWTYDDYAALPYDGNRYEIVNGVLVMAPVPTPEHQSIATRMAYYLFPHIDLAGIGKLFIAPIDVDLGPKNVYQPDLIVVLNAHLNKVSEKKIIGAPDLAVEVASLETALYNRIIKYEKYADGGVLEYWIANIEAKTIQVLVLESGEYHSLGIFRGEQTLPSRIVPDLPVAVERFFS